MSSTPVIIVPPINKKTLFILWALCTLGFLAVIPYQYTLAGLTLTAADLLSINMVKGAIYNVLSYGVLIFVGLYIARRLALGAPILDGLTKKEGVGDKVRALWFPALAIGILGGLIILLMDTLVFSAPLASEMKLLGIDMSASVNPPAWQGLLASLYGGITEEILLRLFVMTLIAGLIALAARKMDQKLPAPIFWIANIMAAVLFGLGHLPATAQIGLPLDFLVVSRAIVLNGLLGVGFGWLYWKHGLESAMLGHFTADIVLHVIFPIIVSLSIFK
jgi:Type II CAAX prenyl endopeptidase Rce1-like